MMMMMMMMMFFLLSLLTLHRSSALSVAQHSFKGEVNCNHPTTASSIQERIDVEVNTLDRSQSCSKDVQKNVPQGHDDLIYSMKKFGERFVDSLSVRDIAK